MKDQLPATGCGVDVLCQGLKTNALVLKISDGVYEVSQRAPQPVQPPDNKRVSRSEVA